MSTLILGIILILAFLIYLPILISAIPLALVLAGGILLFCALARKKKIP